ncbi:MAG: hypothetical protein AAGJ79_07995 [Verrucomicrobiota bacterium]
MSADPPSSSPSADDDFEFEELDIGSPPEKPKPREELPVPPEIDFSEEETAVVFDDEEDSIATPDPPSISPPAHEQEEAISPETASSLPSLESNQETAPEPEPTPELEAAPESAPKEEPESTIPPRRTSTGEVQSGRSAVLGAFRRHLPSGPLEWASFAFVGAFFLLGAFLMQQASSKAFSESNEQLPDHRPPGEVEGDLVTLEISDTFWRDRRKGDPGRPEFKILPALETRIVSGGQSAFIQAIFRDEFGSIQGDAVAFKVEGGKFKQSGSNTATFLGSGGFTNRIFFAEYFEFETIERWTVTLRESADNESWNEIAYFKLPAKFARDEK